MYKLGPPMACVNWPHGALKDQFTGDYNLGMPDDPFRGDPCYAQQPTSLQDIADWIRLCHADCVSRFGAGKLRYLVLNAHGGVARISLNIQLNPPASRNRGECDYYDWDNWAQVVDNSNVQLFGTLIRNTVQEIYVMSCNTGASYGVPCGLDDGLWFGKALAISSNAIVHMGNETQYTFSKRYPKYAVSTFEGQHLVFHPDLRVEKRDLNPVRFKADPQNPGREVLDSDSFVD
jgi:hypothetical protein